MRSLLLVAGHEYSRFVRRRSFLLALAGLPLFLVFMVAAGALTSMGGGDVVVGYVDHAGVLDRAVLEAGGVEDVSADEMVVFETEQAGRTALSEGEVAGLVIVPDGYPQDRTLRAYYEGEAPGDEVWQPMRGFLRASLLAGEDAKVSERVREGAEVTVRTLSGDREIGPGAFLDVLVPFAAGFLFIFAAIISGGYLLQTISDEKENRTVEVLTTSVSSGQLIFGKALGLIGVAATQLLVWGLGMVLALVVGVRFLGSISGVDVPWALLGVVFAFFIPSYLLIAGTMICIGSAFPEYKQSQQVVAIINILFFIPFFVATILLQDPNGTLAVALSFFPTTSLLTIAMRWGAAEIPFWQIAGSWFILVLSAGLSIWMAPRIFRAGMLRYGQRLDLADSWRALRGGRRA